MDLWKHGLNGITSGCDRLTCSGLDPVGFFPFLFFSFLFFSFLFFSFLFFSFVCVCVCVSDRWQENSLLCARWMSYELHSWLYLILLPHSQYHIFCIRLFFQKYSVVVDPIALMFVFSFCGPEHVLTWVLCVLTLYWLKYTVHSCYILFIYSLLPICF